MAVVIPVIMALFNTSGPARPHNPSSLLQRAATVNSDQEKLQLIFDKTVNDIASEAREQARESINVAALLSWRALFIALPVLVVIGALMYLAFVCYPRAVFAWGDMEQAYTEIVARRKTILTVVVVAVLVGIITNLFVLSLPPLR
jgi:predicted phosphatase